MEFPSGLRYTKEHEWIRVEGDQAYVGITDYAQQELGDVVYVELPDAGGAVRYMEPFGVVESVKAVSDLFSPVTGAVNQVNEELFNRPELVNSDPYGQGWMLLVQIGDPVQLDTLMTAEQYQAYLRQARAPRSTGSPHGRERDSTSIRSGATTWASRAPPA